MRLLPRKEGGREGGRALGSGCLLTHSCWLQQGSGRHFVFDKLITTPVWFHSLLVKATVSTRVTYLVYIRQRGMDWHTRQKERRRQQPPCLLPPNKLLSLSSSKGDVLHKACEYPNGGTMREGKGCGKNSTPRLTTLQTLNKQPGISRLLKNK